MCSALTHLHKNVGFLHLDVKPQNVLWDPAAQHAQLIDFSLSLPWPIPECLKVEQSPVCTSGYVPPEIINHTAPTKKCICPAVDAWSLGVTVWEAATARRLFSSRAALEAFRAQWNFGNGCLGLLSGHGAPGELCRLMQMLLHENPLRRVIPREL